ncbi:MAG: UDP-N-acetylmuramoyl-tripeptide--D-alanyl-D-alanine ligase [Blastocatellia bacterium]|nr:UDP-N-acetylmuramoyl-tripeptide--D-alanyl-D-alanine ligase [Blastocatellia bacterium]
MKLSEIAQIIEASVELDAVSAGIEPQGFSIDSRTIEPGQLFFALRGSTHDGHAFVADALARGACAAVVSEEAPTPEAGAGAAPLLRVKDTLAALQGLARAVRQAWGGPVIGITGSAGKTATKELTALMLAAGGARVIKTIGNFNNLVGLPLSVLQLISHGRHPADVDYLVLEMGMNHRGEIQQLCSIAQPDVGVVTLVAAVHLEFFSSVDEIAEAKAEMVDNVKEGGLAVLNIDDVRVARMRFRRLIATRTFGIEHDADVMAREIELRGLDGVRFTLDTPRGQVAIESPLMGRHSIYNALAAATVADYFGVPLAQIAAALAQAAPISKRGEVLRFPRGFTVINDAYNSNPRALNEMVALLCATNSVNRRIVVAGEMLELGESAPAMHRECGRQMAHQGIDIVVGVRGLAAEIVNGARDASMPDEAAVFYETPEAAARWLFDKLREGDLVLVKGSRAVQLERVIAEWERLSAEAE